jgi:hypothetical protein
VWKDPEGIKLKPVDILFPELEDENDGDPNYWKSIIQTNLDEYIRD